MTGWRRWLVVVWLAVVLVVGGCSGESEDSADTSASIVSEQSTSTTEATTTTTTEPTTTSTTVDPIEQAEADVEAAYFRSYEVFVDCYRILPDCDPATAFAEGYTGDLYERLVAAAVSRKADGLVYEPPENPAHAQTQIFDIRILEGRRKALVSVCTFSGDRELAIADDGSRVPVGINDPVTISWGDMEMELGEDGSWRVAGTSDEGDVFEVLPADLDENDEKGDLCGNASDGV